MQRRHLILGAGAGTLGSILTACGGGSGGGGDSTDLTGDGGDLFVQSEGGRSSSSSPVTASTPPAHPKARVIVVGGGMGGATVAKYLRLWGDQVEVTLVERASSYTACLLSSLVLTGQRTLASLSFNYDTLRSRYAIKTVFGEVVAVDPSRPSVTLASGEVLVADRVVLAPGIDFEPVPGLVDPLRMPHAWKAGPQTTALAQQLAAMPAGGTMVLTVPPAPYRCPPGPYERACLIADWMKARKPGSRLIVLDANPDIVAEKDNFTQAFMGLHASVVDYHAGVRIQSADSAAMALETSIGRIQAQVINLIPAQRAGALVGLAGLGNANGGRFAGVDVLSYASTVAGAGKVHVIGDACGTNQPKSGHIANQEAKVCADAIVRAFAGQSPDPAPVTSSACYSTVTMRQAAWLSALFQYDPALRQMVSAPASAGASNGWSSDGFEEMGTWFRSLTSDTFA